MAICEKCKNSCSTFNLTYIEIYPSTKAYKKGYDNKNIILCDKCFKKLYKFLGIKVNKEKE